MAKTTQPRPLAPVQLPSMPRVVIPTLTPLGPVLKEVSQAAMNAAMRDAPFSREAAANLDTLIDATTRWTKHVEPAQRLVGNDVLAPRYARPQNVKDDSSTDAGDAADNDIPDGTGDSDSDDASTVSFEKPGRNRQRDTSDSCAGHEVQSAYRSNDANTQSADDTTDTDKARARTAFGRFHDSTDPSRVVGSDNYEGQAQHITPMGDANATAHSVETVRAQTNEALLPDAIPSPAVPPKPRTP
jgi:hypothetical protein